MLKKRVLPFVSFEILDHPVHAPASRGDPWECEFPKAKNYKIAPVNGVFNLYASEEDLANGKPVPYSYPDLATFVRDMNLLCAMIDRRWPTEILLLQKTELSFVEIPVACVVERIEGAR